MHTKLLAARDSKAVVVTTPIAIKAFILKFVEMLHILDKLATDPKSLPKTNTNRAGDVSFFSLFVLPFSPSLLQYTVLKKV